MELLVDLFGYLTIILHGFGISAQAIAIGSTLFLTFLVQPGRALLRDALGRDIARLAGWAAVGLVAAEAAGLAVRAAVLASTLDISAFDALGAQFALAGIARICAALLLAAVLFRARAVAPAWLLLSLAAAVLLAATLATHAAARVQDSALLLGVAALHQFGAALWIGGIPAFLVALARLDTQGLRQVASERFSTLSMVGVACILVSGVAMGVWYIGEPAALYGTAYGVMVSAKIAMFLALLALGHGNFRLIRRLRHDPTLSINRLRRFAEVEIGVGFAIFFAAASLTSVPPAVDLKDGRVTFAEIVERNWPPAIRLQSPDRDTLTLPGLQAKLAAEARANATRPQPAFVPGSGVIPDRNAGDIAWSEYNHHWAGMFVVVIALMALLNQAGVRLAAHWPLVFLGLAVFLLFRSDPESWPLGDIPFLDGLRDVEVLQHRFFVLLITGFAIFEWRVRITGRTTGWTPLVFPLATALGGVALLTHSHAIGNVKEQLLIEQSHTLLALGGIAGGWARWLELRLDPPGNRIAGWVWPLCFLFVGLVLLAYREA